MPSLSRRKLLGLTALGCSTVLAGCTQSIASQETTTTGTTTTAHQPTTTTRYQDGRAGPASSCPGEYSTFTPRWVVEGSGPLAGFNLTINQRTIALGDTLTVSLQNVTNTTLTTGNRRKYDIQYRDSSGWHTIFGVKDNYVWNDIGVEHEPGQGFTWQFPVTRDGLATIAENNAYGVCAPLQPGTYRFVYWGISTEREGKEDYETDYALGVSFTVTDD